jgi:GT2 family glycosyltransferase
MKFSVVIPTFNRPRDLARCLDALSRLEYPREDFEVIVVDDGGAANLEPVAQTHGANLRVRLLRQSNSGPATARNHGAAHAAGSVLAFIDDDCEPWENWLRALGAAATGHPDALLGGRVINGLPGNAHDAASQQITDFLCQHFNRDFQQGRFFPSNNIALASNLYREIGGFDPVFRRSASEDRDLCDRWLGRGWRLVAVRDAVVVHSRNMSLQGFCKQHFFYGRGAFIYAEARRRRGSGPVPFEGWRFHAGMILAPLGKSLGLRSFYLAFLIFLSQAAVVLGYACEIRVQKKQRLFQLQSGKKVSPHAQ